MQIIISIIISIIIFSVVFNLPLVAAISSAALVIVCCILEREFDNE